MNYANTKVLLSHFWRPLLVGVCTIVIASFLLFAHLGSTPSKLSAGESAQTRSASYNLHDTIHDPIYAQFKVPEHYFVKWFPRSADAARATSVIFGALSLLLFFAILRFWRDWLIATLGTIIFASSSWFLHVSRLASPNVLFFGVLALFACALCIKHSLKRELTVIVSAAVLGGLLYVPGFIWFILIGIILRRKSLAHELKHTKTYAKIAAAIIFVIIILPLVWAVANRLQLGWSVLGLPSHVTKPMRLWRNFYNVPFALFFRTNLQPAFWLGHLPILDIFEDAMFVLGLYVLWRYRGLDRTQFIVGTAVIGIILIALGGPVTISLIIPLVFLVIALGLSYMLEIWHRVFPNNPVARSAGYILIFTAVAVSCNYQIQRYFVAWPKVATINTVVTQKSD